MNNESFTMKGYVSYVLRDEHGNVKQEGGFRNIVTMSGRAFIVSRMMGTSAAVMSHMGLGTSSTAASAGNTALLTEVGRTAINSTTISTTNSANDTITYVATFSAGVATGALTEIGMFNAASAGTMLNRAVFAVVNKAANDSLTITWKITAGS
jgi:hypothetical protein